MPCIIPDCLTVHSTLLFNYRFLLQISLSCEWGAAGVHFWQQHDKIKQKFEYLKSCNDRMLSCWLDDCFDCINFILVE